MEDKEIQEMNKETAYKILSERLEQHLLAPDEFPRKGFHITAELIFDKHGITVSMHCENKERHHMPHLHIKNGKGQEVSVSLAGEILAGYCDRKTLKKIKTFIDLNNNLLTEMWKLINEGKNLKPLKQQIQDIKYQKGVK